MFRFRIFDKRDNIMVVPDFIGKPNEDITRVMRILIDYMNDLTESDFYNYYSIMQYSSILDRNGKLICEGDLVNIYEPIKSTSTKAGQLISENSLIRFDGCSFTYQFPSMLGAPALLFLSYINPEDIEITGNIYETI